MKIYKVEERTEILIDELYNIWEASVRETHTFLSDDERERIGRDVPEALRQVPHLVIAAEDEGRPAAFMGIEGNRLEMLFAAPAQRGRGLGRALLEHAMSEYAVNRLCVNEENPQAKGFYRHMGFEVYRRTKTDEQGNPYPLLYMRLPAKYRYAERKDIPVILSFVRELAAYEKMSEEVVATEELMEEWLFDKKKAEVLLTEVGGRAVGFALFFHNFSTFLGRAGIYLEDLLISPAYRDCGYGKALLKQLAKITVERGCGRLEWSCLDWNRPSIDFYLSLGAEPMDEWTVYRLTGDTLQRAAR